MADDEKSIFPPFMRSSKELFKRRAYVRHQLGRWFSRNGIALLLLNLLIGSLSNARGCRENYYATTWPFLCEPQYPLC